VIILSALVRKLHEKGVISEQDVGEISDLYALTLVLIGKSRDAFNETEKTYLKRVNKYVESGNFNMLDIMRVPDDMKEFHSTLLRAVPDMRKIHEEIMGCSQ